MLPKGPEIISALEALKDQKKFVEDMSQFYPGAPNEITQVKAEKIINDALLKLIKTSNDGITEVKFWLVLESAARLLSNMDSEEIDRGLKYIEEIMDIYGIESSEGRLNKWRYGFDPS